MMFGLPSGLRQRLPPTFLFPIVCSIVELVVVGAPARGWGLRLADLCLPGVDLRPWAPLELGLLGH